MYTCNSNNVLVNENLTPVVYSDIVACSCEHKVHREHCILPLPAAHIILHHTHLVSAIVHALCERDREDVKVCVSYYDYHDAYLFSST